MCVCACIGGWELNLLLKIPIWRSACPGSIPRRSISSGWSATPSPFQKRIEQQHTETPSESFQANSSDPHPHHFSHASGAAAQLGWKLGERPGDPNGKKDGCLKDGVGDAWREADGISVEV